MAVSKTQRCLDFFFVIVFMLFAILFWVFDAQLLLPEDFYCQELKDLRQWYLEVYKDPIFSDPPAWFVAIHRFHLVAWNVFFVVAIYGFARGRYWVRVPGVIFATNLVTVAYVCISYILTTDFYYHGGVAPHTEEERLALVQQVYAPGVVLGLVLLVAMLVRKPTQTSHHRASVTLNNDFTNDASTNTHEEKKSQ